MRRRSQTGQRRRLIGKPSWGWPGRGIAEDRDRCIRGIRLPGDRQPA